MRRIKDMNTKNDMLLAWTGGIKAFLFFFLLLFPHPSKGKQGSYTIWLLCGLCSFPLYSVQKVGDMAWWSHMFIPSTLQMKLQKKLKLKKMTRHKYLGEWTRTYLSSHAKLRLSFAHCCFHPHALHGEVKKQSLRGRIQRWGGLGGLGIEPAIHKYARGNLHKTFWAFEQNTYQDDKIWSLKALCRDLFLPYYLMLF